MLRAWLRDYIIGGVGRKTVLVGLGSSRPVYSDKFLFDGTTIDELFIAKEISENQSKGEMIRLQEKLGWKTLQGPVIFEKKNM